jgi:ribonuclease HI/mannose-6-phosphate isomerase-like protein (cupin superfamily)
MEIYDASELMRRVASGQDGARTGQIYPAGRSDNSLVAVDLLEIEPGRGTRAAARPEEQIVYVLSGSGDLIGGGSNTLRLQANSVVRIDHDESAQFRNTGRETLRLLVIMPLVVWSSRAQGVPAQQVAPAREEIALRTTEPASPPPRPEVRPARVAETPAPPLETPAASAAPAAEQPAAVRQASPQAAEEEAPAPTVDISSLVKKASELPAGTKPERRRPPAPEPEQPINGAETAQEQEAQEEDEEAATSLMELLAVFDGGRRGNPGQGYGSFLVQSPNRKPVIKRIEFGDNYTNNQAEYDSLIKCLEYIIERLEVTNRSPSMVQLEIKTDSDLVANQVLGNFKVKDAGLRKRHAQALELLDRFAEWSIAWQPREETVKLLGH